MSTAIPHGELFRDILNGTLTDAGSREKLADSPHLDAGSVTRTGDTVLAIGRREGKEGLWAVSKSETAVSVFTGETKSEMVGGETLYGVCCDLGNTNARQVRQMLPHTGPSLLSGSHSFGTGDRIGGMAPATPGHIDALRYSGFSPVLAQQSVRENTKTGRTFAEVLDDVTWTVLRTGYTGLWGADADHLKGIEDIANAVRAGFTFFTLDPSDLIDHTADNATVAQLGIKLNELYPSEKDARSIVDKYEQVAETADRTEIVRSLVKYTGAVRHAVSAYRRLVELKGEGGFDFELSIDETATETSVIDHRIIATECRDAGVKLYSLAPRFPGAFEKGIDYKGSIDDFRASLAKHVSLSKELGGYRLSMHSGSDKFSVYPIFGELTDGYFHVKTAGTSYLEAVKTVATADFDLFREIYELSLDTFEENAASYEISADPSLSPALSGLTSAHAVDELTNNPHMRQVLHIAFGVVLKGMGDRLRSSLRTHGDLYREYIATHIGRHVALLRGGE